MLSSRHENFIHSIVVMKRTAEYIASVIFGTIVVYGIVFMLSGHFGDLGITLMGCFAGGLAAGLIARTGWLAGLLVGAGMWLQTILVFLWISQSHPSNNLQFSAVLH